MYCVLGHLKSCVASTLVDGDMCCAAICGCGLILCGRGQYTMGNVYPLVYSLDIGACVHDIILIGCTHFHFACDQHQDYDNAEAILVSKCYL